MTMVVYGDGSGGDGDGDIDNETGSLADEKENMIMVLKRIRLLIIPLLSV